jgi:CRP-like cAMP-binding protein
MEVILKPFEVNYYSEGQYIVQNPETHNGALINEYQLYVLRELQQSQYILQILFLPNGLATKKHVKESLSLVRTLHKLNILNPRHKANRDPSLPAGTPIRMESMRSLAMSIGGIFGRILGVLTLNQLLLLGFILSTAAFALFPYEWAVSVLQSRGVFSYPQFFIATYLTVAGGLTLRAILKLAALHSEKRNSWSASFKFFGPFCSLGVDDGDIKMAGLAARVKAALLGALAPGLTVFVVLALLTVHVIHPSTALIAVATAIGMGIIQLFPFFPAEGAELLHCFTHKNDLQNKVSDDLYEAAIGRGIQTKSLYLYLIVAAVLAGAWTFAMGYYFKLLLPVVISSAGSGLGLFLFYFVLFLPALLVVYFFMERILGPKDTSQQKALTISRDEQLEILERVPLYMALDPDARLTLFNGVQATQYNDGDVIVRQGDVGDEFYVMAKGKAHASYRDQSKHVHFVGNLMAGDAFGEIALIDDVPRTATITANGPCLVLSMKKAVFQTLIEGLGSTDKLKQIVRLSSFFQKHPLLSKLTAKDKIELIDQLEFESITANESIEHNLDKEEKFYIMYSGRLQLISSDGSEAVILEAEDCFGAFGDQEEARRPKVQAMEGAGLLSLSKTNFEVYILQKLTFAGEGLLC